MSNEFAVRWWQCSNSACRVMWGDAHEVRCWACGAAPERANRPFLTSQTGQIVHRIPNVRG